MRDYSSVSGSFWIGKTGKELRGDMPAQLLALYLMTSPHSTMTGVYHCPILYMSHETGMTLEGATEALHRLIQAGFCEYEEASESVFVIRMAAFQIGEVLKPGDKRILGMPRHVENITSPYMKQRFIDVYGEAFHIKTDSKKQEIDKPLPSPSIAPAKPGTGTGTDNTFMSPAKLPTCPVASIVKAYHEILPDLPRVRVMDNGREKAIRERWKWVLTSKKPDGSPRAADSDQAAEWFKMYFERARDNDFLMGRTGRQGEHQNWRPDIDYLMTTKGLKQVIEKTAVAA